MAGKVIKQKFPDISINNSITFDFFSNSPNNSIVKEQSLIPI